MFQSLKFAFLSLLIISIALMSCQEDDGDDSPSVEVDTLLVGTWNSTRHTLSACENTEDYEVETDAVRFIFSSNGNFEEFKHSEETDLKVSEGKYSTSNFNITFSEVEPVFNDASNLFGLAGTYEYTLNEGSLEIRFGDINSCQGLVSFTAVE